jgi:hypothetical protein
VNAIFIGNSFTARNDLPGLIANLAMAKGHTFRHRLIWKGGASLRAHWNAGEAQKAIQTGQFDAVVLQEQSTLPVKNAARMHENVRLFDQVVRESGAKTYLYMTWARQHAPKTQEAITTAYTTVSEEISAAVVPVGIAWQNFLAKYKTPNLYDKDESHPSLAGSYLAACCLFTVLLKVNPVGLSYHPEGLGGVDSQRLQAMAWKSCDQRMKRRGAKKQ